MSKFTDLVDSKGKPKIAPVQGYAPGIPWSLHLEAYDAYCKKWSKQEAMIDLEGRGCRGGFSTGELDGFIPGWRDKVSEMTKLKAENAELRAEIARLSDLVAIATGGQVPEYQQPSPELLARAMEIKERRDNERRFEERVNRLQKDRKSTRLNSSHIQKSRMPSSA